MKTQENQAEVKTESSNGTKDFFLGALIGGAIGAAAALFLSSNSGKEIRSTLNDQAAILKDKGEKLREVAMEKGSDLLSVAKQKSTHLTQINTKDTNKEVENSVKEDVENIEYIQLVPTVSKEDLEKKLLETQRAIEEAEVKFQ